MNNKTYQIIKAATNILSGVSMATLIVLGVSFVGFNNAFVFNNAGIAVTNNPVTGDRLILF